MPQSTNPPETPLLLLDRRRLDGNIARMRSHIASLGVNLRPHVKTHKSLQVAQRLFDGTPGPITVSTLREADAFFAGGYRDLLYGVAIAPDKFRHAANLIAQGAQLTLILDNAQTAALLLDFATAQGCTFDVLLEIDCDGHRSGLAPDSPHLEAIARQLHGGPVRLRGVMTHAGNSYDCRSLDDLERCAREERDAVVRSAERLRRAGVAVDIVSVGSTPTALFARDLTGVTEVRAGVFTFFDLVMTGIGVCRQEDIALSVLTSVIGHQEEKGWTLVDAGWMALSRDRGTAAQPLDQGYGVVCDLDGRPLGDLIVGAANQEHGIVRSRDGATPFSRLPIGTLLRILPNHACATAAQYPGYHVDDGQGGLAFWPRLNGW